MRAVWLVLLMCVSVSGQIPDYADVPYATGWATQKLDIYLPQGTPPFPTVVYIHSGAWSGGDKSEATMFATDLLNAGFAVVAINYRTSNQSIFPAQIYDCKGAMRWLRANGASYSLDTTWLGVWGWSAGGHLATLLGASNGVAYMEGSVGGNTGFSSAIQAVVNFSGPTDILNMAPDVTTPPGNVWNHDAGGAPAGKLIGFSQGIGVLRGNPPAQNQKYMLANTANPLNHLTVGDPPMFVAHGTADMVVPIRQSERLVCLLEMMEIPFQFEVVVGAGHTLPITVNPLAIQFFVNELQ